MGTRYRTLIFMYRHIVIVVPTFNTQSKIAENDLIFNVHNGKQDLYFVAKVYAKYWYVGRVTDVAENEVMIHLI